MRHVKINRLPVTCVFHTPSRYEMIDIDHNLNTGQSIYLGCKECRRTCVQLYCDQHDQLCVYSYGETNLETRERIGLDDKMSELNY